LTHRKVFNRSKNQRHGRNGMRFPQAPKLPAQVHGSRTRALSPRPISTA
jgi:hypothetical protein